MFTSYIYWVTLQIWNPGDPLGKILFSECLALLLLPVKSLFSWILILLKRWFSYSCFWGLFPYTEMKNICKIELHSFVRSCFSIKKRALYTINKYKCQLLYEQYYRFMNHEYVTTYCYFVEFLLFLLHAF